MSHSEVRSKPRKLQCGVEKLTDELGASEKDPNSLQSVLDLDVRMSGNWTDPEPLKKTDEIGPTLNHSRKQMKF